ncbi:MAG: thioredoxin family protein [Mesonia hippocampi]|uniref:thioredoxin family protein n=1 Tax=Mesonia hippocampi TaxID=1628250 RepID=UPI003F96673F
MTKFGDLIRGEKTVLFTFYTIASEEATNMHAILKKVAGSLEGGVKIIRINAQENIELAKALRIQSVPTLLIYKNGEMVWRQSGKQQSKTLVKMLNDFK